MGFSTVETTALLDTLCTMAHGPLSSPRCGAGATVAPLGGGRWHRGLRRSWPYPWGIDIENILSIKSSMNVDNLMIYLMHGDLDRVFTSKNGENMETSVDLDCFFHQQSTLDTAISNALLIGNE